MRTVITMIAGLLMSIGVAAGSVPALAADTSSPPQSSELAKAQTLIAKKDFAAAVPLLKAAVAETPKSADAWNLMGYAHRKLGQTGSAEEFYQKALALDAGHRGTLEYLGELYVETGRLDEAKKMLKRLDDACFFGCQEFDALKSVIEGTKASDEGTTPKKW